MSAAYEALSAGATLSISVSGGKDSQAMLNTLLDARVELGWFGHTEIVHADLGRMEWPQTAAHVERLAEEAGLPLVVVRRAKGDLVQRIEERLETVSTLDGSRPAKPFWPSPAQRYCTSDMKRDPIAKHLRTHGRNVVIVSAIGMRADESPARAKRPTLSVCRRLSSKYLRDMSPDHALAAQASEGGRLVLNWLAIHTWSEGDVWIAMGTSAEDIAERRDLHQRGLKTAALYGWPGHPAYVWGNTRLSCALCIMASKNDLLNGIKHNPELAAHLAGLEERSGFNFTQATCLGDLIKETS